MYIFPFLVSSSVSFINGLCLFSLMKFIPEYFILFDAIIHGNVLFIYFSWRLITLQYCSGFCHTLIWISHGCTCVPHPEPPSHLPPHPIPLGQPSAPALSTLSHELNLDWWSVSHMIIYMFQFYSLRSSTLAFSHRVQKTVPKDDITSVSLLLSRI